MPPRPEPASRHGRPPAAGSLLELARAAGQGDTAATARLLRALGPEMLRVVRGVMGAYSADADDAFQQSLVALIHALPAFRGDCAPGGYACRIAFRTALAARTSARRAHFRTEAAADLGHIAVEPAEPPLADGRRRAELVRGLLDQIPEEQAEALALRTMLGWTIDEIAAASAVPRNTVRSRLRLAKEALRRRIEADPALRDELEVEP